jgi:hypothetical protein
MREVAFIERRGETANMNTKNFALTLVNGQHAGGEHHGTAATWRTFL